MDRREWLGGLAVYALLARAVPRSALGKPRQPVEKWLTALCERCLDLRAATITPAQWQAALDELYREVPLADLVTAIDLDRVLAKLDYPRDIGAVQTVPLPAVTGRWDDIGHKIFAYRKGACTPPHAHNNVASAHLVLRGDIHVRTYDRVADSPNALELAPTFDKIVGPGHVATTSDAKHNVHWFAGASERSCSLDIVMSDVVANATYATPAGSYGQIFVDPTAGRLAPILSFQAAVKKFGGT